MRLDVLNLIRGKKNVAVDSLYELSYITYALNRKVNERMSAAPARCSLAKGLPLLFGPDHQIYWCTCTNLEHSIGSFDAPPEDLDKNQLLNDLLNRNIFTIEKCRNCIFRYICSTGCPLFSIHTEGKASVPCCGVLDSAIFDEQAEKFLMMKI